MKDIYGEILLEQMKVRLNLSKIMYYMSLFMLVGWLAFLFAIPSGLPVLMCLLLLFAVINSKVVIKDTETIIRAIEEDEKKKGENK